jgi:uncharacterized protein (PEP-CTERM system associated)
VFSAFDTARVALSQQQSDSELLGSQLRALNDDTRQRGLNTNWNVRLSSRTSGILGLTASRTTSSTTGLASNDRLLRAGLSHRFDRQLRGALEVRHHDGSLGAGSGQRYRENAVAASISVQL